MKNVYLVLTITLLLCSNAIALPKTQINILTWWGYLDDDNTVKNIQDKCHVEVTHDNYISNDDMLRRWNSQLGKYDLLIFSDTIYNVIKDQIKLSNSHLSYVAKNYNPTIAKHYYHRHYPNNIVYFGHALTGFIWNAEIIQLSETDTLESAFRKAKDNKVILLDDPFEINTLLNVGINKKSKIYNNFITVKNIQNLTQRAHIYLGNEINQIYFQKDFAFSYQWSGTAFSNYIKNKKFHFLINKNLSYISTDMLAQLNKNSSTICVANVLASKGFLSSLQNNSHYFSPYGNINDVKNNEFKMIYTDFLKQLPMLSWLEPSKAKQLSELNQGWYQVKYELTKLNA